LPKLCQEGNLVRGIRGFDKLLSAAPATSSSRLV
jgi:hypothetical protein